MIECRDLGLSYKDGHKANLVLNGVNLKIRKGENVVLLGPSGSGKSSLIYLLSGLKKPTTGNIFYEGANIGKLNEKASSTLRKNKFGFIFQMHFLIPYLRVIENVLTGVPEINDYYRSRAFTVLRELGIDQYAYKKIYQLSGGERQRVAIARALVSEPDVIFADEPTASLDHDNAVDIVEMLKKYKENSTLVMATHDTSILAGDERILRVEKHGVIDCSIKEKVS